MSDSEGDLMLRVTDSVPGVNWRPTRFAERELNRHACSVCRLVPQSIILLPCSHALCDSCHAGSGQDGSGACPIDWEPFEEADCQRVMLHARKANSLKAFCWNRVNGCDFVGVLADVLRHFEQDCTFHAFPCSRCGENVLHRMMPMHFKAECTPSSPYPNEVLMPPRSAAIDVYEARSTVSELKDLLARQREHQLPDIMSGMKKIIDSTTKQSFQLQEMSRELTNTEQRLSDKLKKVAHELSASLAETNEHQRQSQSDEMPETSTAEADSMHVEKAQGSFTQMSWNLEQKHILRKLEIIANDTFVCLQNRHRNAAAVEASPGVLCELVTNPKISEIEDRLDVSPRRSRPSKYRRYRLNVKWTERIFSGYCSSWDVIATASRWHTWDTHLSVAVCIGSFGENFQLHFKWHGRSELLIAFHSSRSLHCIQC